MSHEIRDLYLIYTYLIKYGNLSLSEARFLTPAQRELFCSCLAEHMENERKAVEEATKKAQQKSGAPSQAFTYEEPSAEYTLPENIKSHLGNLVKDLGAKGEKR